MHASQTCGVANPKPITVVHVGLIASCSIIFAGTNYITSHPPVDPHKTLQLKRNTILRDMRNKKDKHLSSKFDTMHRLPNQV